MYSSAEESKENPLIIVLKMKDKNPGLGKGEV